MSRDQRTSDNWALLYAQEKAMEAEVPVVVVFNLVEEFLGATRRQFHFMLSGLRQVKKSLQTQHNIDFVLLRGDPTKTIPEYVEKHNVGMVVTDFSPLRIGRQWKETVAKSLTVPFHEVDAHNVVPCWLASKRQETGARTLRKPIWELARSGGYLEPFPSLVSPHPHGGKVEATDDLDVEAILASIKGLDETVKEVSWIQPGEEAAQARLAKFLQTGLAAFAADRNRPDKQNVASDLSPYLHFGQISAQRCIQDGMEAKKKSSKNQEGGDSFLEEIFVRRELAENYCYYNTNYDSIKGAAEWAQLTLKLHSKDKREYVYSEEQLETGKTHDLLWNAGQMELVKRGKMHGFMRMYWAKKILEWTVSPEEALRIAILFNDKYSLDGRDSNGYVGCMWSICGAHDMGFKERPVFGKIRFMNYAGCERKFKKSGIEAYQKYVNKLK